MICPQCGFDGRQDARFCAQCGAALGDLEPSANPAIELKGLVGRDDCQEALRRLLRYVPGAVAEGVLHDQQRLRGERREVAIMFVDAVNFTHLSESLDPESIFDLINDLLSRLVECVHRYGGMVDKFTGDGLMAVFGAPMAHENDPEMAVRAALDMQQAAAAFEPIAHAKLGAPLQVRIGIHAGPAVAGILGTKDQAAYTVIGESVNLASRIESLAEPGHVLVSERVYERTHALFEFEQRGTAQVKGIRRPVAVYEAVGDHAVPRSTRGLAGVASVFLGRRRELEQVQEILDGFTSNGNGRLVVVRGEAGMGKSRLTREGIGALPPDAAVVWTGRGLPYAQGIGYGIFASLMRDALRSDVSLSWEERVSPALRPFLQQMLGEHLPVEEQSMLRQIEPQRVRQLTELALREWIGAEAEQHRLILILEDFHWADDTSRDMLNSIVNVIYEAPVLVWIIARPVPELQASLQEVLTGRGMTDSRKALFDLEPLSQNDSRALLGSLVDLDGLPETMVDTILTRAQGNPFYIEEFVRGLIEKDVLKLRDGQWRVVSSVALQELEIPTTLRGLMMARIDRLPEDLYDLLRVAAVIGLQFSARLLGEAMHRLYGLEKVRPMLERLDELGLIVQRPEVGSDVYAFRHIVAQEAVYRSLLRSQRPELHRTIGEAIEALYADDLSNQAEVLALHYDLARVRGKAMRYALEAGDRARQRFANRQAIEHYARALQLSQHIAGSTSERWHAAVCLGQVEQHIGEYEEAVACFDAALNEWARAPVESRAEVHLRLGQVWDRRGEAERAERELRQADSLLDAADGAFPSLRAQVYAELGTHARRRGDFDAAQAWLERGLALVDATEHYDVLSSVLNRLGAVYYYRGERARAVQCVERALEIRQRLGDIVGEARSLNNLAILNFTSGDWDQALDNLWQAAESHERIGEAEGLMFAHTNLGILYTERGDWQKARQSLDESLSIAQRIGHPYEMAQARTNLGRLHLLQQAWEEADRELNAAIALYQEAGARGTLSLTDSYYYLGVLNLEQVQIDEAAAWAARCRDLLEQATGSDEGDSVEWARYARLVGRVMLERGDMASAGQHLEQSAAICSTGGFQIELGRTTFWQGVRLARLGEGAEARDKFVDAVRIFADLGARRDLALAEESLAQVQTNVGQLD